MWTNHSSFVDGVALRRNCDTLQHNADHRIKPYHAATHCNTLQRIATHWNPPTTQMWAITSHPPPLTLPLSIWNSPPPPALPHLHGDTSGTATRRRSRDVIVGGGHGASRKICTVAMVSGTVSIVRGTVSIADHAEVAHGDYRHVDWIIAVAVAPCRVIGVERHFTSTGVWPPCVFIETKMLIYPYL